MELKHPADLNPWQIYRQAKKLTKHTSRAKNADWYRGALELDRQWHLWFDGEVTVSAIFDRPTGQWHEGPELPEFDEPQNGGVRVALEPAQAITDLHIILKNLLAGKELGGKMKSLGVILHLADEFSLADISAEYAADEEFDAVNELLALDPQVALGDPNVDSLAASWRALPYWGIHDGDRRSTAIQVSRAHQALIAEIRLWGENNNIPVIASAVSAPLEALRLASVYIDWTPGMGDMILLQYRRFSAFAVLGTTGELMMMRALPHVGERRHPSRLGETLVNTAASMNLVSPRVHIVQMGESCTEELVEDLGQFFSNRPAMDIGVIELDDIDILPAIPGGRMEMLVGQSESYAEREEQSGLMESETFKQLSETWAIQDFYGLSSYEREVYPERRDLKILKIAGIVKLLLFVVAIGLAAWTGFEFLRAVRTPAWRLDSAAAASTKAKMQTFTKQNNEAIYWENVMAPRSEGWLVMELLLELFPPEAGIVVVDCDYRVVGHPLEKEAKETGFDRKWSIKGFARPEGAARLSQLSSNRFLAEQFERVAEAFDSESLRSNPDTRMLDVTMQQRQGQLPANAGLPASVARHYRTSFELSIKQTFDDEDELALTAAPPF